MLDVIERECVAVMTAVPTMLSAMVEAHDRQPRETSSLRLMTAGGAATTPHLAARVQVTFGCLFTNIYGLTETSPTIFQTGPDDTLTDRIETASQPLAQTEFSISVIDHGGIVSLNTVSEVCMRGVGLMLGYNDDPATTAEAIDADGWFHTGDLGVMDSRGFVRITGRVKDMIIRGGENIYPAEIEAVMVRHLAIAEVAIVGVPDPHWGEIAVCFMRMRAGAVPTPADLVAHARAELAAYKTPAQWIVVDAFPLTGSGKIQKFLLRERYLAGEFATGKDTSDQP